MIDREAIFYYIEADSPGAAAIVDDRIQTQARTLLRWPHSGRIGRIAGTRELVIARTPYIGAYRVEDDKVRIMRVLHDAQQWPDAMD